MSVATVEDVQNRFERNLTTAEQARAQVFLDEIEVKIVARIPTAVAQASTDPTFEALLISAEANSVIRKIRNPAGFNYEAEGNYSYTFGSGANVSSDLALTDQEWASLGIGGGAFSVPFALPPWTKFANRYREGPHFEEWT